jgi:hypothetical protein
MPDVVLEMRGGLVSMTIVGGGIFGEAITSAEAASGFSSPSGICNGATSSAS